MFRRFISHNVASHLTVFVSVIKLIQYRPNDPCIVRYPALFEHYFFPSRIFITVRKRSWRTLCFHIVCLSTGDGRHPPPSKHLPPGRHTLPWQTTPQSCWHTVNKRAVRILLECNLVTGRNEVVAKVIFLHLFVILFMGGGGGACPVLDLRKIIN